MATTPLVLVPGLNCTAALWLGQVEAFGAGRAVMIADHTAADTMVGLAAAILADAPPRFCLAGLSMGGYVAFEILRQAPERVERLALLDTQAREDGPEAASLRRQQIAIAEKGGFDRIVDLQLPRYLAPAHLDDADLVDLVRSMAAATGVPAFVRQQTAILGRIDSRPSLAAIACPTAVIVGAEDAITPVALAREMVEGVPGAWLEIVPEAGHLSPIENPEAVNAAFGRWLAA